MTGNTESMTFGRTTLIRRAENSKESGSRRMVGAYRSTHSPTTCSALARDFRVPRNMARSLGLLNTNASWRFSWHQQSAHDLHSSETDRPREKRIIEFPRERTTAKKLQTMTKILRTIASHYCMTVFERPYSAKKIILPYRLPITPLRSP